jgi:hypothetical protein
MKIISVKSQHDISQPKLQKHLLNTHRFSIEISQSPLIGSAQNNLPWSQNELQLKPLRLQLEPNFLISKPIKLKVFIRNVLIIFRDCNQRSNHRQGNQVLSEVPILIVLQGDFPHVSLGPFLGLLIPVEEVDLLVPYYDLVLVQGNVGLEARRLVVVSEGHFVQGLVQIEVSFDLVRSDCFGLGKVIIRLDVKNGSYSNVALGIVTFTIEPKLEFVDDQNEFLIEKCFGQIYHEEKLFELDGFGSGSRVLESHDPHAYHESIGSVVFKHFWFGVDLFVDLSFSLNLKVFNVVPDNDFSPLHQKADQLIDLLSQTLNQSFLNFIV